MTLTVSQKGGKGKLVREYPENITFIKLQYQYTLQNDEALM